MNAPAVIDTFPSDIFTAPLPDAVQSKAALRVSLGLLRIWACQIEGEGGDASDLRAHIAESEGLAAV